MKGKIMGGKTDEVKGRIKEAVGALTGDDKLRNEGRTDQAVGKIKQAVDQSQESHRQGLEAPALVFGRHRGGSMLGTEKRKQINIFCPATMARTPQKRMENTDGSFKFCDFGLVAHVAGRLRPPAGVTPPDPNTSARKRPGCRKATLKARKCSRGLSPSRAKPYRHEETTTIKAEQVIKENASWNTVAVRTLRKR